jgi:hypothetical protein
MRTLLQLLIAGESMRVLHVGCDVVVVKRVAGVAVPVALVQVTRSNTAIPERAINAQNVTICKR